MDLLIKSKEKDLGGFIVHRSLPQAHRRHIGPFVFLDHMGPVPIDEDHALDVRPHPHIGLATVTYLFSGRGFHRDTLGNEQLITPGDLNWMTAGKGIAHSERSPREDRDPSARASLHGVQIWVGLPAELEECEPSFAHWPKTQLPDLESIPDLQARVLIGEHDGKRSPVHTEWPMLFMDLEARGAGEADFCFDHVEAGIFIVQGSGVVNETDVIADDLVYLADPRKMRVQFSADFRAVVIGGKPFPEPRHMWWNFVSSRKERIREAARAWESQSFGKIPGETEFIPLPKDPLP